MKVAELNVSAELTKQRAFSEQQQTNRLNDNYVTSTDTNLETSPICNNRRLKCPLTTFKATQSAQGNQQEKQILSGKILDRNSLESINSKFSLSSANDESQQNNIQTVSSLLSTPTNRLSSPGGIHVIGTRYVSPPKVSTSNEVDTSFSGLITNSHKDCSNQSLGGSMVRRGEQQPVAIMNLKPEKWCQEVSSMEGKTRYLEDNGAIVRGGMIRPSNGNSGRSSIVTNGSSQRRKSHFNLPPIPTKRKQPFKLAGIAASILGSVFFSFSILCIKLLPNSESFVEKAKVLFFRGIFMMFLCGSTLIINKSTFKVPRDEIWINLLRAVFGTLGVFGSYCSLNYISMGDSTALVFSSPIWTSILSHFILNEPLQWLQLIALPATTFGIIMIAHPALVLPQDLTPFTRTIHNATVLLTNNSTNLGELDLLPPAELEESSFDFQHRWPGIVIALFTSLLVSCTYIVLKFRKSTPIQTTTFWLGFCMLISSTGIMSAIGFGDIPNTFYEWFLLFSNGFTSWMGQSLLQWALLHEEAGILSVVRTLDVAMTFILSAIFLDEDLYWTSILGATIIGIIVVSMMLNTWIQQLTCMAKEEGLDALESREAKSREALENVCVNSSPYIIAKA